MAPSRRHRGGSVLDRGARVPSVPRGEIGIGSWLMSCRAGSERDLIEELASRRQRIDAWSPEPGLVVAPSVPRNGAGRVVVCFARQIFRVRTIVGVSEELLFGKVAKAATRDVSDDRPCAISCWTLDSPEGNRHARVATALERHVRAELPKLKEPHELRYTDGILLSALVLDRTRVIVGSVKAADALSLAPGGRARMKSPEGAPARSARKLEEAFQWLGHAPEAGEICVDLGAAPGGWTKVLLERRARVIAVDPGKLTPEIANDRRVRCFRGSAFNFEPEEPVDWLFCDMVWRPLEVAELLAKWGRRRWAQSLVANIKLPMKQKVAILARVDQTLEQGGWTDIRMRQLYHDRDEVTVTATRAG